MSLVVGLTGGIGCGKSAVADCFVALGVPLVDTDAIAHELTGPGGAAMPAIRSAFGDGVVRADGSLDRAAMRSIVFANFGARVRLESILHPRIRTESRARVEAVADAPYVILAVPLLIEAGGWRDRVDRILVVDCAEETQIARVVARSGMSPDEVRAIIAAQATRGQRFAAADDMLHNDGDLAELPPRVATLHRRYLELAAAKLAAEH